MNLISKIRCLFNEEYCEVPERDGKFHERTEKIVMEQEEVETRLRALGTRVDVTLRRGEDGKVLVDVEQEPGNGNSY